MTTDDEQLDVSFSAFRRVETRIALFRAPSLGTWPVSPGDLERALATDAAMSRS